MNETTYRKLFSNFASLSFIQGINFMIPLLITPFVITKVGIAGIGVIALAQTIMTYLSTITDYGCNVSATKEIALHKNDSIRTSEIFFTTLALKVLITFFLLILLLVLSVFLPIVKHQFILYALGFTFVAAQAFAVNWFFLGIEKMHYITIGLLVSRFVFVVLVFLFIQGKSDDIYYLFFLGIGNFASAVFCIFIALKYCKVTYTLPKWSAIREELKKGWQVTISILSLNTYLLSGIFILRLFTNDLIIGYYSIAVRIFFAVRQILAVFSEAIFPHVCQLFLKGMVAGNMFFKRIYYPFLFATIAGCTAIFILSPQLVFLFIKEKEALPILLLRILSFTPVIICLHIPAYQLLLAFDKKASYLRIFSLATPLNIVTNILLVNEWGATGTALSIVITEIFITIGLNREVHENRLSGYINARLL